MSLLEGEVGLGEGDWALLGIFFDDDNASDNENEGDAGGTTES
jgi:hypothetical protein